MFADKVFNIPYSEYWLPLVIGMGVGLMAVLVLRTVLHRPGRYVPRDNDNDQPKDFDPFMEGSRSDQRRSFRRQGSPIRVLFALPTQKEKPNEGWVINRSMGGVCMGAGEEIPVGTVLSLLPLDAPPMTPWVDVEVRSCRRVDDQIEVGCQFVKVPPWSILLLFG